MIMSVWGGAVMGTVLRIRVHQIVWKSRGSAPEKEMVWWVMARLAFYPDIPSPISYLSEIH